jgi:hypothetical protein
MLEPDIMNSLHKQGLSADISKKTSNSLTNAIKTQLMPIAREIDENCQVLFQLTNTEFSADFGALALNSSISKTTTNPDEKTSCLIYVRHVVYVYLLANGNISIGFTDRTFLERTREHVNDDGYKIYRVIALFHLKPEVPMGESCRSLEAKVHHSLAKHLNMDVKLVSESKAFGFKCDLEDFFNCVMTLPDMKYYQSFNPTEFRHINNAMNLHNLLVFK